MTAEDCQKRYYENHKEELRAKARAYYHKHRDECNARNAVYQKTHLAEKKEYRAKNRRRNWTTSTLYGHKQSGFIINISFDELYGLAVCAERCFYCTELLDWSPGRKGPNTRSPTLDRLNSENEISMKNAVVVCHSCNSSKRQRTHWEFVEYCYRIAERFGEIERRQGGEQ